MNRTLVFGVVLAVAILSVGVYLVYSQSGRVVSSQPREDVMTGAYEFNSEGSRRQLGGLSLDESLAMLDRPEHYDEASPAIHGSLISFSPGTQQKIVFSNRLFRKCVQEMKFLPQKEAARKIENHIDETLQAYMAEYELCFNRHKHFDDLDQKGLNVPVDSKDLPPPSNIRWLRYKLHALLLLAGTYELTDCHAAVSRVAHAALNQKEGVLELGIPRNQRFVLDSLSLLNPMILAAGLYGTHPDKGSPKFNDIAERCVEHQMVDYTARFTEYDHGAFRMVDPDKEYIQVRYFEKAAEEDVLTLLELSGK